MANAYLTNFAIPSATNNFQCVWGLTRAMKAAGWTYKASGDGTNKDTSGTAANDLWGGSSNPLQDSYTAGSESASTTMTVASAFPVSGVTITVGTVSGFNASGGTFYVNGSVSPVTYTSASGTTFLGCTGGPTLSSSTYTIKGQPALSDSTVGWIVLSGPQTQKIALNASPTGTPVRGEILTQATSGATGELLGYVWDAVGLTGWMVIGPQSGTFNSVNSITGGTSSATLVPLATTTTSIQAVSGFAGSGVLQITSNLGLPTVGVVVVATSGTTATISYTGTSSTTLTGCTTLTGTGNTSNGGSCTPAVVTFNREICFAKIASSTVGGYIYYVCADPVSESAVLLSTLATQTGCTALIPPGGGGTNNPFNTNSPVTGNPMVMCVRGTNVAAGQFVNTLSVGTDADYWFASPNSFGSHSQIGAVNCTPSAGVTADGSFYVVLSTTNANQMAGFFYTRVDSGEPGDCDPYVFFSVNNTNTIASSPSFSRLSTSGAVVAFSFNNTVLGIGISTTYSAFFGYQSRGNTLTTRDVPCAYAAGFIANLTAQMVIQGMYPSTTMRANCTPASTAPLVREPMSLFAIGGVGGQSRQSKGRCRWVMGYSIGSALDTYDTESWLNIYAYGFATNNCAIAIGPYNGSTTPVT